MGFAGVHSIRPSRARTAPCATPPRLVVVFAVALALVGCTTSKTEQRDLWPADAAVADAAADTTPEPLDTAPNPAALSAGPSAPPAYRQMGTGQFIGRGRRLLPESVVEPADDDTYSVNLIDVPIAQAAKAILGDTLAVPYSLAPKVEGTITLLTTNPLSRSDMLETFNTVLELNGLSLKLEHNVYTIEALPATVGVSRFRLGQRTNPADRAVYVLPLKYVSTTEMIRILQPIVSSSVVLSSNSQRNILFATGSGADIEAILDAVSIFDIDVLQGKSVSLYVVRNAAPSTIAGELEQVFDAYEGGALEGVLRFLPNDALSSILIISSQPEYIARAEAWIERYEAATRSETRNAVVYHLDNRTAVDLLPVLSDLLSLGPAVVKDADADPDAAAPASDTNGTDAVGGGGTSGLPTVVADDVSNSIIAYGTAAQQQQIGRLISLLDEVAHQVLLEATIAEVALNDELAFGVRWFFESGNFAFNFTGIESGSLRPTAIIPSFNAIFAAADVRVAINALASVTDINIISSPSVLVLDNREAVLSVGDQVPIATQSVVSISDPDAPIVNSITQEDTGVILKVRPRVSSSGRVILEIQQEVSDVVATVTSGIDSPTIQQRLITTTVAVDHGQSVALGGLIRERREKSRDKVPVLGDVPVLGAAFRSTRDSDERTELLVIITPKLIHDATQAREVTDEFRRRLSGPGGLIKAVPRTTPHTFRRILR